MGKKYKIGDKVVVTFIGTDYTGIIVSYYDERVGSFWVQAGNGTKIPAVGTEGSEKWANIWKVKQKNNDN